MIKPEYSRPVTEFEIQAELFYRLKALGYKVRGEIGVTKPDKRNCRFDLVIFDNDENPALIIEVKKDFNIIGIQGKYYESFTGLPCIYCFGPNDIDKTIRAVWKHILTLTLKRK